MRMSMGKANRAAKMGMKMTKKPGMKAYGKKSR